MDDKKLDDIIARVDKSLDGMDKSLREIVEYMGQLRAQAQRDLEEKIQHLQQLTTRQPLMSNRWHRRDGDGFPIVQPGPQPKSASNADSPPGDIRPPKLSGD